MFTFRYKGLTRSILLRRMSKFEPLSGIVFRISWTIVSFALLALLFLNLESCLNQPSEDIKLGGNLSLNLMLDRKLLLYNNSWPPNVRSGKLQIYKRENLVMAFEKLLITKLNNPNRIQRGPKFLMINDTSYSHINSSQLIHVAFLGDSRIRQLFTMFLKAIPDYDRFYYPPDDIVSQIFVPHETIAYSKLLGVMVSFCWESLLVHDNGEDLSGYLNRWISNKSKPYFAHGEIPRFSILTPHPDILVIGIAAHHMLTNKHKAHEKEYFQKLEELLPIFKTLSENSQIVWLNQYPTRDMYSDPASDSNYVNAQKLWHYNQHAQRILKKIGMPMWDSASPLIEEYIRSCSLSERIDGTYKHYFECTDYIHPGLSALTDVTQILYNLVLPHANF